MRLIAIMIFIVDLFTINSASANEWKYYYASICHSYPKEIAILAKIFCTFTTGKETFHFQSDLSFAPLMPFELTLVGTFGSNLTKKGLLRKFGSEKSTQFSYQGFGSPFAIWLKIGRPRPGIGTSFIVSGAGGYQQVGFPWAHPAAKMDGRGHFY